MSVAPLSITEQAAGFVKVTGDCSLTLEGHMQASQLAEDIRRRPPAFRPQLIVSSPYLRAVQVRPMAQELPDSRILQTAQPLARAAETKIAIEPALQEAQVGDGEPFNAHRTSPNL
jgi:broad specificity phosphatase PhoE